MKYPLTRKALKAIDAFTSEVDKLLFSAVTNRDVLFHSHLTLMRSDYVRQAYLLDTVDRHLWDEVRVMSVETIRAMVEAAGKPLRRLPKVVARPKRRKRQ